jgi:hypothetical protein
MISDLIGLCYKTYEIFSFCQSLQSSLENARRIFLWKFMSQIIRYMQIRLTDAMWQNSAHLISSLAFSINPTENERRRILRLDDIVAAVSYTKLQISADTQIQMLLCFQARILNIFRYNNYIKNNLPTEI